MMIQTSKYTIQIEKKDDHLVVIFPKFSDLRKALKKLKKKHKIKGTWKNYLLFYLPLFDDYYKEYFIDEVPFHIETDGFTWMDGLALVTKNTNETIFEDVVNTLND